MSEADPAAAFPAGFFDRSDPSRDDVFYGAPRLVTHIDPTAIAAVGDLYDELAVTGDVLDMMSSWISHFRAAPASLTILGMNQPELQANPMATAQVIHDLNSDPALPFADSRFDDVTCCVSVDYLTRPIEVFADVARILRPGGRLICTFSNRCFPTKAIRGWLMTDDDGHCDIVAQYFDLSGHFEPATVETRVPPGTGTDPLYAVWARRI